MRNFVKFKLPKTRKEIEKLPFVERVFYEGKEDGWWIWLKAGYASASLECGLLHEPTIKELISSMSEGIYTNH